MALSPTTATTTVDCTQFIDQLAERIKKSRQECIELVHTLYSLYAKVITKDLVPKLSAPLIEGKVTHQLTIHNNELPWLTYGLRVHCSCQLFPKGKMLVTDNFLKTPLGSKAQNLSKEQSFPNSFLIDIANNGSCAGQATAILIASQQAGRYAAPLKAHVLFFQTLEAMAKRKATITTTKDEIRVEYTVNQFIENARLETIESNSTLRLLEKGLFSVESKDFSVALRKIITNLSCSAVVFDMLHQEHPSHSAVAILAPSCYIYDSQFGRINYIRHKEAVQNREELLHDLSQYFQAKLSEKNPIRFTTLISFSSKNVSSDVLGSDQSAGAISGVPVALNEQKEERKE